MYIYVYRENSLMDICKYDPLSSMVNCEYFSIKASVGKT